MKSAVGYRTKPVMPNSAGGALIISEEYKLKAFGSIPIKNHDNMLCHPIIQKQGRCLEQSGLGF